MPIQKIDRRDLIQNSLRVFKEKGYHKTTMSDIAEVCGLQKGSIYHYIKSKEELMEEVLRTLSEHYSIKVFQFAYDDNYSPTDRLKMLALKSEEIFLEEKGGNFFVSIGLETKNVVSSFEPIIKDFFQEWIRAMTHIFCYKLEPSEAQIQAEIVVAEVEGAVMLMQLLDDENYLKRTNKKLIEAFEKL